MPFVKDMTDYETHKEVKVGMVSPGHTVLLASPDGKISRYQVCRIGNTDLIIRHKFNDVLLTNIDTGRVVLKHRNIPCVVVSSEITLTNYDGDHSDGKQPD